MLTSIIKTFKSEKKDVRIKAKKEKGQGRDEWNENTFRVSSTLE